MSDFLSFDCQIPGYLRIGVVPNFVDAVYRECGGLEWIRKCSQCKRVLINRYERNDDRGKTIHYGLYLMDKVIDCIVDKDKKDGSYVLVALHFGKDDYYFKNRALHSGRSFYFDSGLSIAFNREEKSFLYHNGRKLDNYAVRTSCTSIIRQIEESFDIVPAEEEVIDETFQPSDELMEYLNLAKEYSQAQHELEEKEALKAGSLYYEGVEGCDYDRIENTAYRFYVHYTGDQKDVYVVDTKVEISDINDEKIHTTIVNTGEDEKGKFVDLLFYEQKNIEIFPRVGAITLSFSSVNRDVQMEAINKIVSGTADARYMNDILGDASPKGFDDVNLDKLEDELNKKEYPPNDSQLKAIKKGICSKDAYLVMGPPGTGKTTVIFEWVKYFVKEKGMRVLISSKNNKAVDNVLEKVIGEEGINPLRIGSETKVSSKVKPCIFELKLEELRSKIESITSGHKNVLKGLSDFWQNTDKVLVGLEDTYKEKKELEDKLEQALNNLYASYVNILRCRKDFNTCEERLLLNVKKANRFIKKEKEHRERSVFLRFITKPVSWLRIYLIRYLISKHDRLVAHRDNLIATHNSMASDYMKLYDAIAVNIFMPERNLGETIREKIDSLGIDYDGNKDKWGIFAFEKSRSLDVTSYAYYTNTRQEIKESISRANELTVQLDDWTKEACETSNHTLKEILLKGINVVGATCIGINSQKRFADLKFDVSIIDEAGQIQIHDVLVPMSVSNKLIMLGDHKQIPPMVDEKLSDHLIKNRISTEFLEKSLFEHMYMTLPDSNKMMLDMQYRMPAEIADILSDWFYGGEYKSFEGKMNLKSLLPVISEKPFIIIDTSDSEHRHERSMKVGEQTVHDNPLEAEIAAKIGAVLYEKEFDLKNVGIIAALKAQVELIRKNLKKMNVPSEYINELAATLDSYQGQERDVIVYSFGRSSNKDAEKNGVGFLTELRRLNVAMSRCKETLVIVGDMSFLSERESETDYKGERAAYEKTEKNFGKFISYMLRCVSNGSGEIINVNTFEERLKKWKNQG